MRTRGSKGAGFPEYFSKYHLLRDGPRSETTEGLKYCVMKIVVVRVIKGRKARFVGRMTCMGRTKTRTAVCWDDVKEGCHLEDLGNRWDWNLGTADKHFWGQ